MTNSTDGSFTQNHHSTGSHALKKKNYSEPPPKASYGRTSQVHHKNPPLAGPPGRIKPASQPEMASTAWRRPFAWDFSRRLLHWATWIPVVVYFNTFVAEVTFIRGGSMYPFLNGDKDSTLRRDVALNWKMYSHDRLARGMIVTFR